MGTESTQNKKHLGIADTRDSGDGLIQLSRIEEEHDIKEIIASNVSEEVTAWDQKVYEEITAIQLSPEQRALIATPDQVYPGETAILAIHWHPEFIPLDLIQERLEKTFPNKHDQLIIPTQHNEILAFKGYSGVEVDCYSREFDLKVQLLLHFQTERAEKADMLKAMIQHTSRYRSGQLFEFLETIIEPRFAERLQQAAQESTISAELVEFIRVHAIKLKRLLIKNELTTAPIMIKNNLVRDYFDKLRDIYPGRLIDRSQFFLIAVKRIVKAHFNNEFFYDTQEMIAEARSNGAGIVVPHPEQFWPILLADYDVDAIEVWNPQSFAYTQFLITAVQRLNQSRRYASRPILITMGDDCHLSEKVKHPDHQDLAKASREIGVQPGWHQQAIHKQLARFNINKASVIAEYRSRLT